MARQFEVTLRASCCMMLVLLTGCSSWSMRRHQNAADYAENELKDPARLHLTYAQLSEKSGDIEKARNSYNNALAQDEGSVQAILGLARLDLLGDRPQEAEQGFLKALRIAPKDSRVAEAAGQFYMSQDRFKEATKHLLTGTELNPRDKRLRHRLGLALARQGQIAAAEPHFIQAVGAAEADYNIGLILYEQGDIDKAEQRFFQASLKKPELAQAQHWLDTVRQERANQQNIANRPNSPATNSPTAKSPNPNSVVQHVPTPHSNLHVSNSVQASNPSLNHNATNRFNGQPKGQVFTPQLPSNTRPLNNKTVDGVQAALNNHPRIQPLNPATMSATQLEQLENSMTPIEREQFRQRMQNR